MRDREVEELRKKGISNELNALSHAVIGAAIEVHKTLGPGFLETVYQQALCVELELRHIPFDHEVEIGVGYRGRRVGEGRLDILVADALVLELKAVETLLPIHEAQLLSYLKATGHRLGLLMNFNMPVLRNGIKRIIR